MGINCNGTTYLSCQEANLCCQKGDHNEVKKRKMYQEYIEASQDMNNLGNSEFPVKKKGRDNMLEDINDSEDDQSINILDESNYYESNGEIFCIETADGQNVKKQTKDKNVQHKVEDLKKVEEIKNFYKISFDAQDLLGNGAFAMVRLCSKVFDQLPFNNDSFQNSKLSTQYADTKYAIKMMRKSHIDTNKIYKSLLENEIDILRDLNHPRCMKIFDLYEDDKYYYVISEFIQGGSVMKRLKENGKPYSEWTTYLIVKQILEALSYIHSRNIAHRDLKLENLMFVSSNKKNFQLKLIDFGFAQHFDRQKGMSLILGSPLYMAPELVKRQTYDDKVDVWALGCVTFLLLSGQTPFQSREIPKIHKNTLNKKVTFNTSAWSEISKECKQFILDCLERDPLQRKSSKELYNQHPWIQMYNKIKKKNNSSRSRSPNKEQ